MPMQDNAMDKRKQRPLTVDRYKMYQFIASLCVALFITNFALCLLVMNRGVFREYVDSEFEKELIYDQLAGQFSSFFEGDYELAGYELSKENIENLGKLKTVYRVAWIVSIFSLCGGIYSFVILSKRRLYMPLLYGGLSAALLTAFHICLLFLLKTETAIGVKNMILHEDYSFFGGEDVLKVLFAEDFAKHVFLFYLLLVFLLIVLMTLIRMFIIYCGRPHKF